VVSSITMYNMWHLFVACRKQRLQFDTREWHILHNSTYVLIIPIIKLQFVCTKCHNKCHILYIVNGWNHTGHEPWLFV